MDRVRSAGCRQRRWPGVSLSQPTHADAVSLGTSGGITWVFRTCGSPQVVSPAGASAVAGLALVVLTTITGCSSATTVWEL